MIKGSLSDSQLERYGRQVIMSEIGEAGQLRLLNSRVLMIGAGGLGSACLIYLAAAGVGHIGIVDYDVVDMSNLQRQIIHGAYDVGRAKVQSAAEALQEVNPECRIECYRERVTEDNVMDLIEGYDIVVDGSDNFPSRYAIGDACGRLGIALVSAAVVRMEGQLSIFKPYLVGGSCYRCLYPSVPDEHLVSRCDSVGILSPIAGILGTCQALEVIKELLCIGETLWGKLLLVDGFDMRFYKVSLKEGESCEFCKSLTKR